MKNLNKNRASIITLMLSSLLLGGCGSSNTDNTTTPPKTTDPTTPTTPTTDIATQIFKNGKVYTVNDQQEWADAVAIKDNKIIFVGSNDDVQAYVDSSTKVTDLSGKMLMPGFHDVHMHPIESASENTQFAISVEETNPENFIQSIKSASQANPGTGWLIGYGHSIFTLLESARSPLAIIDEAVSDRPVIIMEQTSHSMWVNSAALALAGFTKDTPHPTGGRILRDENTGELNGILIDNAGNIVMDIAMAPTTQSLKNDYDGLIEYTLPELAKHGITSISDARSFWKRDDHTTWLKAQKNDALTARVSVGLWAYPTADDATQLASLKALYTNDADSLLKFNQIKLYSDGIIINATSAMLAKYNIDLIGLPENKGLNYFSQQRIEQYITALEPAGFDFHMHAIGDRGIREALNAVENSATTKGRHRITHVEIIDPADIPRFAQLNVTADAQVAGNFTNPEHWHENDELIGAVRSDNAVPIKSLDAAGARITLSSDWNVSPFNPFLGLQNAVTRAPQELSLTKAIKAYTLNSAYVMRQEDKVGSIEVGKLADFVVLDRNIFDIAPNTINQTKIFMTVFDGETIYQR
ncbi:amidohydrolase [Colwellia psychrerythraea]|uniref:Amidohydrolase 3 n=1 Tax=Colwellia psychrerythraea TaxID=28229 RepID=A0A099KYU1_COLPS|nr:amidohydrolase [Colwellia psychrerythraea]KGJ95914.1 Amidohydrolase 3 [Colwellia psychrerythraea]